MANEEHMNWLTQGTNIWNRWRLVNNVIQPDLSGADLSGADLSGADLSRADLSRADLSRADLVGTKLSGANLFEARLREADLNGADLNGANLFAAKLNSTFLIRSKLSGADLNGADLNGADLSEADLNGTNLIGANLGEADLSRANLIRASLVGANLVGASLVGANLGETMLAKINLRTTKGLATIDHWAPSHIELFSVQLPQDGSTLHFLRGAGVPDEWIDDYRAYMMHPIQYHSCFISYSGKDKMLASRLHADLQAKGVRCWFAPEDMKIGDKIHRRIDEAIHLQDKLLLLLSEHALASDWVETEVLAALEKERQQRYEVLFPVRLDERVMQAQEPWAKNLRLKRHIGDFTNWREPEAYQVAFERLLRDLKQG